MSRSENPTPRDRARARESLRLEPLDPARAVRFRFDGQELEAGPGEMLSAALHAGGLRVLRTTSRLGEPRGLFCNMGICFECLVEVDGQPNVRACQTVVRAGMQVRTQHGAGIHRLPSEEAT